MPATPSECVQLALEETPRYEGAVTTTPLQVSTTVHYLPIQSTILTDNPTPLDRGDEVRGNEGEVQKIEDSHAPAGTIAVRGYIDSMTWLLTASGLKGVYTAGDGIITDPDGATIPVGAARWVFSKRTGLTAKTLQILACYVKNSVFLQGQGYGVTQLQGDAAGAVQATLEGLVLLRTADPNLTPSYAVSTIMPMRHRDLTLTWLTGSGTTSDFTWQLAQQLNPRRTFSLATPSFYADVMEQGDNKVKLTGTIPKSTLDQDDYDQLIRTSAGFSAKAKWVTGTSIGATAKKYSMWIEMPKCQYVGGSVDPIVNARRYGGTFNWEAAWDESSGYDFKITLVNGVTVIDAGAPAVGT